MNLESFADPPATSGMAPLRRQVRAFLATTLAGRPAADLAHGWAAVDPDFSRALGAQGWIGMVWPSEFGGRGATALERYTVIEELLAAGAPVAAHWFADRQSGAMLLRHARPEWRDRLLPRMAAGELFFCIGMSEPGAGSDLAAIRTRARPVAGGWSVSGSKIWTSFVHHAHYMIALVRTGDGERQAGLSQLLIDLASPGITIRPIEDHAGERHFAEIFLDEVFVPADMLLGREGEGWAQVNAELALERSGPERYLSSHRLIEELADALGGDADASDGMRALLGAWVAELWCLRRMSLSVAATLAKGEDPMLEAAIVKDRGARFEQSLPRSLQAAWDDHALADEEGRLRAVMDYLLTACPAFSLRGGTREVLRGIIARGLGLR